MNKKLPLFKGIKLIYKKEISESFSSPIIYIFAAISNFIMSAIFYNNLQMAPQLTNKTIVDFVIAPTFSALNFILLFFAPMLTMGAFVKEKRENTFGLLKLSNLTDDSIFFAKYFAAATKLVFITLPIFILPLFLAPKGFNDFAILFTNMLGIYGLGLCYLIVGLNASLLSRSYIASIVISFGALFSFLIIYASSNVIDNEMIQAMMRYFSFSSHIFYFARGAVSSFDLVYILSFVGFFSFIGIRNLGVRK
ncbi:ABC transporter permease [Oceanospirillum sp. RT-1-3]|uniref:ABC transporter permease n=1 Tax=unclassified Halobacteriovorax TaxID=2639665 RepID=UPI00399B820A